MRRPLEPREIEAAFLEACRLDVAALKPGNVHVYAAGHRMQADDFTESARVAAPFIADPALSVGRRIRLAVEATFEAVGCNTNLGILLLAAPLAAAAEAPWRGASLDPGQSMARRLEAVLDGLTHDDARDVYAAIAGANPAGLGSAAGADVHDEPPPGMTLLEAMRMAAPRDLVAKQYATGFGLVIALSRSTYGPLVAQGVPKETALGRAYLAALAVHPDTHIARKHGAAAAEAVRGRARSVWSEVEDTRPEDWTGPKTRKVLLGFDAELKSQGYNPGSLADLMVAAAFLSEITGIERT